MLSWVVHTFIRVEVKGEGASKNVSCVGALVFRGCIGVRSAHSLRSERVGFDSLVHIKHPCRNQGIRRGLKILCPKGIESSNLSGCIIIGGIEGNRYTSLEKRNCSNQYMG